MFSKLEKKYLLFYARRDLEKLLRHQMSEAVSNDCGWLKLYDVEDLKDLKGEHNLKDFLKGLVKKLGG